MVAILSNEREVILDAVCRMYSEVAAQPGREFHFPTGRRACEFVGYPSSELDRLPPTALESFAGVGYPFTARAIHPSDIGSGSGTDVLIARRLTGATGRVFGLDMTAAMREKLRTNASIAKASNVHVLDGHAESIPLPDACVDVLTTNGVLNLVPDKKQAIREIARVLRRGGRLQLADIVVETLPSAACRAHPELWAECVVGATTVETYVAEFTAAGFQHVEVLSRFDYFSASSSAETRKVAGSFGAHSVVLHARMNA
jgi:ubiquinone/menaquinone biosynthesis C-methylase UbiE